MITLTRPTNESALQLLHSTMKNSPREFKQSVFCISQQVEKGELLYSTLSGAMVLLNGDDPKEELYSMGFLVDSDLDEHALCTRIREELRFLNDVRCSGYTIYTILPTTDCNARCFYCYETGCQKISMDDAAADDVVNFILQSKAPGNIKIRWFGGEPLLGSNHISRISNALSEKSVSFSSSMTSNGYLFDDSLISEAVSVWKLGSVQITLDGTEDVYNRRKAFPEDRNGAFARVTNNIEKLLNAGIKVKVRLNADNKNTEDLSCLIDQLSLRFGGKENFLVYVSPIFDYILISGDPSKSAEERSRLFSNIEKLDRKLETLDIAPKKNYLPGLKLYNCIADDPSTVTILPDGKLHACEHFICNHFFGSIEKRSDKTSDLSYWRTQFPEDASCASCPLQPVCFRMQHCPNITEYCIREERERRIQNIKAIMLNIYKRS